MKRISKVFKSTMFLTVVTAFTLSFGLSGVYADDGLDRVVQKINANIQQAVDTVDITNQQLGEDVKTQITKVMAEQKAAAEKKAAEEAEASASAEESYDSDYSYSDDYSYSEESYSTGNTGGGSSTPSSIYIGGYRTLSYNEMCNSQTYIDQGYIVCYPYFSGTDGGCTYLAGHNPGAMSFLSGIGYGSVVSISDGSGTYYYQVVDIQTIYASTFSGASIGGYNGSTLINGGGCESLLIQFCVGGQNTWYFAVQI